ASYRVHKRPREIEFSGGPGWHDHPRISLRRVPTPWRAHLVIAPRPAALPPASGRGGPSSWALGTLNTILVVGLRSSPPLPFEARQFHGRSELRPKQWNHIHRRKTGR